MVAALAAALLLSPGKALNAQDAVGSESSTTNQPADGQILAKWEDLAVPMVQDGQPLKSLRRLVRHFDFEEAELRPIEMPFNFHRVIASDRGFPPFGDIGLRDDYAANGKWSLGFDLNGGSMAARMPTTVVPVLPYADYAVSVRVRTAGLTRAFARIVGQFHDQRGKLIPESRVESRPLRTKGEWTTVSINVEGDFANAADLVLELQLLQPGTKGTHDPKVPAIEDIHGKAWFDALHIWHMPRVDLTTGQPGNICYADEPIQLHARVIDMASEPLRAELWVYNHEGAVVHHAVFDPPVEQTPQVIALPVTRNGWYRAVFDVHGEDTLVGRRWLDFVVVPHEHRIEPDQRPLFAVDVTTVAPLDLIEVPVLVERMGVSGVIIAPWRPNTTLASADHDHSQIIATTKTLLDDRRAVLFALREMPLELADSLGLEQHDTARVLADSSMPWKPYLESVLIRYGLEVPRWLVGGTEALGDRELTATLRDIEQNLANYVPHPDIAVVSNGHGAVHDVKAIWLNLPNVVRSRDIHDAVAPAGLAKSLVRIGAPPVSYTPQQTLAETMTRGLHVWRSEPDTIIHPAPWHRSPQQRGELIPTIAFSGLHTLIHQLRGRRFAGELDLGEHVNAWILRGEGSRSSAIVAWKTSLLTQQPVEYSMNLGTDTVIETDAFGNSMPLPVSQGLHRFRIESTPVFLEGIDADLALFRTRLQLDDPNIDSAIRVQERDLIIHNPWPIAITGEIRLYDTELLQIQPRVISFVVAPGQSEHQLIECMLSRAAIAGPSRIRAEVSINADRQYLIQTEIPINIGLEGIEITAQWLPAIDAETGRRDLIVSLHVRNDRDEPIALDAFALGQGISQQRTAIGTLEPDTSTLRHFTIENGITQLAGQVIRVGVAERDGPARLNTLLEIPPVHRFAIEQIDNR